MSKVKGGGDGDGLSAREENMAVLQVLEQQHSLATNQPICTASTPRPSSTRSHFLLLRTDSKRTIRVRSPLFSSANTASIQQSKHM